MHIEHLGGDDKAVLLLFDQPKYSYSGVDFLLSNERVLQVFYAINARYKEYGVIFEACMTVIKKTSV